MTTAPARKGLKNGHLVGMTLALLLMSVLLLVGGAAAMGNGALDRVEVEVVDIDTVFTDKKGEPLKLGASTVLDPGGTLEDLKRGYIKSTLDVDVRNGNRFGIEAEKVDYKVYVNDKLAGEGTFPAEGKAPISLPAGEPFSTKIDVKLPTKKVFKSTKDLKKIVKGTELEFKVTGTAHGKALGLPATREFTVTKTKKYP